MLRCAKCGAGVQGLAKCPGCGEPAPRREDAAGNKGPAVVLLVLLLAIAVVSVMEFSGKRSALPPGVFGLFCGGGLGLLNAFPQPWTIRRIAMLSIAGVLVVLSSLELAGVLHLGFYIGAAGLVLALLGLTMPKTKS
jgi:hypothetical protein